MANTILDKCEINAKLRLHIQNHHISVQFTLYDLLQSLWESTQNALQTISILPGPPGPHSFASENTSLKSDWSEVC